MSSKSVFDEVYGPSTNVFDEVYGPKKESKLQEPVTLKGTAGAYLSGLGGGASGIIPDILNLAKPLSPISPTINAATQLADALGLKGTHEQTKRLQSKEPQNALERILEQAGIFGGQEGLIGAGLGGAAGPAGALAGGGLGTAHGSITGTVYGSLKEAGVPDEWALLGSAIATISPIAFQKAWPKLVSKFKSGATAEEAAQSVFPKGLGTEGGPPPGGAGPGGGPGAGAGSEITSDLKKVGKAIKKDLLGPNISEEIPASISPQRFRNTTQGGKDLEKAVEIPYKKISAEEKRAYDISSKANAAIEEIHPELVNDLRESIQELSKIPDPSAPLARYIKSSEKLLHDIADIGVDGTINGYKPISNQVLIKQIQEYNQIPKYDFPTDTKTGIFKGLIEKATKAVDTTAAKHPKANEAWKKAKEIHARKSDLFDDPDVAKWIKLKDKNYSKDFISSIDVDKIRKIEPVLNQSAEGRKVLQEMKREIVEKKLEDFFTVGQRFDKKQIAREIAELEPILTPEEIENVEALFEESRTVGAKAANIMSKTYRVIRRPTSLIKEAEKIK
jgi:hypothetical protein